jgi:hypothetical protein
MHHDSTRRVAVLVLAGLLVTTLACGGLPGQASISNEEGEAAPELVEPVTEEIVEEPTAEAPEKSTPETAPPTATTAPPVAFAAGSYAVRGTNPDGSVYEGTLRITEGGKLYEFVWEAGNVFVGEGIQRGDRVAVAYPSDSCQVALYDIGPDGTLTGDWVGQEDTFGTETATPTSSTGTVEGTYAYQGAAADGHTYEGTMTIAASGDLYTVAQEETGSEGSPLTSIGIRLGQAFAMSYGPGVPEGTCGIVLYTVQPDGSLDGVWGAPGVSNQAGTELATPQ